MAKKTDLSSKEMTRADYIKLCRFYKGEKGNPLTHAKDKNKSMLWELEKRWVDIELSTTATLLNAFNDYKAYGLLYFAKDGVPEHLKALIFNSWMKTSMDGDVEPFKEFYFQYYK